MSIPPLVCSTPPPPDQCEDDKDHDDYELQYNLSQEDDENNDYDFENYSTYNHFETRTFSKQEDIPSSTIKHDEGKVVTDNISVNSEKENGKSYTIHRTKDTSENKLDHDDDFDIEDLNLKIDSESSGSSVKDNSSGDEISRHENSVSLNSLHIPNIASSVSQDENSCLPTSIGEPEPVEIIETQHDQLDTSEKDNFHVQSSNESQTNDIIYDENTTTEIALEIIENDTACRILVEPPNILENTIDDDFGEFDEFQYIAPESKLSIVMDNYENPWENTTTDDTKFGNFTANFDKNEISNQSTLPEVASEESHNMQTYPDLHNNSDSFGDFDNFQSSATQIETKIAPEEEPCDTVHVLNLQSTENEVQIMESINKVLSSLFQEEISEPINENEVKLESLLSETWGHLTETDVRQPYIINWNSSLGQKTLLRALCIDSRNILFGPKWSYNMPKYAANLSSAPLQPQKQLSNTPTEVMNAEKTTNKSNNWSDPFSANGQESCNTESESNDIELQATDVAMSTKSDKIYSSTLNVQPIRQINLPDTHIFTPTDSETPRSKTIHYDNNPTVLLAKAITDKHESQLQGVSKSPCNIANEVDDDYWEFQEFKTTTSVNTLPEIKKQTGQIIEKSNEIVIISSTLPNPSMAYQTNLLQPIKIEPAIPTLNWPDPGEVKEEFDAFSDFVSTSSWVDKDLANSQIENTKQTNVNEQRTNISNRPEKIPENEVINSGNASNVDDDFDTFQSALPTVNKTLDFKMDILGNVPRNNCLPHNNNNTDFDQGILKESSGKTDSISYESTVKSNESLPHTLGFMMNTAEPTNKNVVSIGTQLPMNLLQPIPPSSTVTLTSNQQKSGQILQPLSLESYSQINWPSPGIDLQDLSRFNPVETLHSLKSDLSASGLSKSSPVHNSKPLGTNQVQEDDVWGDFVSSKPTSQLPQTKKLTTFGDDDEWTDFVSSPSVKPHNGLNTISLNVHTNSNMQKTTSQNKFSIKTNQISLDIPTLNYITPKTNSHKSYNDRHFQNL